MTYRESLGSRIEKIVKQGRQDNISSAEIADKIVALVNALGRERTRIVREPTNPAG